jgi:signal transduction histidine kinase/DNA-binding response OmpR family regulator
MPRRLATRMSLRAKVTGISLVITGLTLALSATISIVQMRYQIEAEQHRSADSIVLGIARASELPMTVGDAKQLARLLNSFLRDPELLFIAAYTNDTKSPVVAIRDLKAWQEYSGGITGSDRCIVSQRPVEALEEKDDFPTDVEFDPGDARRNSSKPANVGRVVIGLSTAMTRQAQGHESRLILFATLAAAAVGGTFLFFTLGSWLRRLQDLASATQSIARGDFSNSVSDRHDDEIGRLAHSFEGMRLALMGRDAKLRGFTETLQDQVKQRTHDLEHALLLAEEANRAKSLFLAHMSHELRTPLNGVIGMVDLLLATPTNPQQRRYCDLAKVSALSLLDLINDVLDFSKIEAGKLELESADFDLHEAVEGVAQILTERAVKKSLELTCEIDPQVPRFVTGDAVRFRQVLTNLVSNAVKFTERGKVVVKLTLLEQQASKATVRIDVRDTGLGIPKDRQDRLFKSFSQVDASTTRKFGGSGLGLAISQRITEMMGGQMSVESEEGKGSTFSFTAQLQTRVASAAEVKAQSAPQIEEQALADSSPLQGLKILLAEDHEINQMVAGEILTRAGSQVTIAANGQEALEAVQRGGLDLVLMDCQMPILDGLEATRRIRKYESESNKGAHIPIIALTANAIKGDRELCLAAGMDGYVTKPIEAAEVIATIQSLFSTGLPQSAVAVPGAAQSQDTAAHGSVTDTLPVDFNALRRRCLGNRKLAAKALNTFAATIGMYVQTLSENLQNGDAKSAATAAHKIKGAAGNVSAQQVLRIASELEELSKKEALDQTEHVVAELQVEIERVRQFVATSLKELVNA